LFCFAQIAFTPSPLSHPSPPPCSKMLTRDVELDKNTPCDFLLPLHAQFLHNYVANKEESYEQLMVEYLKMSGIYWTTTALQMIDRDFGQGLFLSVYCSAVNIYLYICFFS
jgi:hypothetical protein